MRTPEAFEPLGLWMGLVLAAAVFGWYIGVAKTRVASYQEGCKFGFALGRLYYASGDSFDRRAIGAIFREELKYAEYQDLILHYKIAKEAGCAPSTKQ